MKNINLLILTFTASTLISGCNMGAPDAVLTEFLLKPIRMGNYGDRHVLIFSQTKESSEKSLAKPETYKWVNFTPVEQEEELSGTTISSWGHSDWIHPNHLAFSYQDLNGSDYGYEGGFGPYLFYSIGIPTYRYRSYAENVTDLQNIALIRTASVPALGLYTMLEIYSNGEMYLTVSSQKRFESVYGTPIEDAKDPQWLKEILHSFTSGVDKFCVGPNDYNTDYTHCERRRIATDALPSASISFVGNPGNLENGYPAWDTVPVENNEGEPVGGPSEWWSVSHSRIDIAYRAKGLSKTQAKIITIGVAEQLRPTEIYTDYSYSEPDEVSWAQRQEILYETSEIIERPGDELWINTQLVQGNGSAANDYVTKVAGFSETKGKVSLSSQEQTLPEGECQAGYLASNGTYYWLTSEDFNLNLREIRADGTVKDRQLWDESESGEDPRSLGNRCTLSSGGSPESIAVIFTRDGIEGKRDRNDNDAPLTLESRARYLEWSVSDFSKPTINYDLGSLRDKYPY